MFELSSGEYFKWAAADDLCAPDFLQRCTEILDHEPRVVVCYAKTKIIDAQGEILRDDDNGLNLQAPTARQRFLQLMRSLGECNAVFGLIRSPVLKRTRLIGNYIASDSCLLAELSLHGRIFEIPEYLFFRRDHPMASSRNRGQDQQLELFDPARQNRFGITIARVIPKAWQIIFGVRRFSIAYDMLARLKLVVTSRL